MDSKKTQFIINGLLNEDGTTLDNFPKNPLKQKWHTIFPSTPKPEYSQVCDGYSCMWCGRCPKGSYWEVPEEDKEEYENYLKQVDEYNKIHNPSLYKLKTGEISLKEFMEG